MASKNDRMLQLLTATIYTTCKENDLRFCQLIEIIKKDDFFYKSDAEIIEMINDFVESHTKQPS